MLSSGVSTDRVELYIVDLFRIYLTVYPGDVPGSYSFGFNFSLGDTFRADLRDTVLSKVNELVSIISNRFNDANLKISIYSLEVIDEELAKLVLNVNSFRSEEIVINLYNS